MSGPGQIGRLLARACKLQEAGRLDAAERIYRRILRVDPHEVDALHLLAGCCNAKGRYLEAVALLTTLVGLRANVSSAWNELGIALRALGRYDEALGAYRLSLRCDPNLYAMSNMADLLHQTGNFSESIEIACQALRGAAGYSQEIMAEVASKLLFTYQYQGSAPPPEILRMSQNWHRLFCEPWAPLVPRDLSPTRMLRVGFLSADFREHVIARAMEATFEGFLDLADEIEIFAFSTIAHEDAVTKRLRGLLPYFHVIAGMSDPEATAYIRGCQIDILVDLTGRTGGNRLPLFAKRPAPIQASYLGSIGTTGMPEMDYLIGDDILIPPDTTECFSEEIVRLKRCYQTYAPPEAPDVGPAPFTQGFPFTFGSFNALAKLSDQTIALWSKVLHHVPGARLLVKAAGLESVETRARLHNGFAAHKIDIARVLFMGRSETAAEHLAAYGLIDVALDTTPFSSGGTAQDALWMGVPVLALAGDRMIGRYCATNLDGVALWDWIVRDPADYGTRAHDVWAARDQLPALRGSMRARILASSYCDGTAMAAALTESFRAMWLAYLVKQKGKAHAV